jgi:HK97 family phage portal protein
MGIISNMERRMAAGTAGLADSWYQPGGFFYGGSGIKTKSGASVSELNAMQLAVVWRCISKISGDGASLPLILYERRDNGGKYRVVNDPLYPLLHDSPNPEMTAMSFREAYMAHILSWGNGFAEIVNGKGRVGSGVVESLWPITPNRVTIKRNKGEIKNIPHKAIYFYISMSGTDLPDVALPKEKVLHTPGFSFNGLNGYSPIAAAREAIGIGKTLEEYGASYFENGIHPSFIISSKVPIRDTKTRREALEEVHSGLGHAHRVMFIEEAEKVERLGIPNDEAQFLETRKYTNIDIGTRIYGLPPHMYGELDSAIKASVEQNAIDYVTGTLRMWLVRFEQSVKMSLVSKEQRGTYFYEHLLDGLLRGDSAARADYFLKAKSGRWMTTNEIRARENLDPIEGGDVMDVTPNMIPPGTSFKGTVQ